MVRYVCGGCLLVVLACGGSEPPAPRENVLELVLGGENKSLTAALRALRPAPAEPRGAPEPAQEPPPGPRTETLDPAPLPLQSGRGRRPGPDIAPWQATSFRMELKNRELGPPC